MRNLKKQDKAKFLIRGIFLILIIAINLFLKVVYFMGASERGLPRIVFFAVSFLIYHPLAHWLYLVIFEFLLVILLYLLIIKKGYLLLAFVIPAVIYIGGGIILSFTLKGEEGIALLGYVIYPGILLILEYITIFTTYNFYRRRRNKKD